MKYICTPNDDKNPKVSKLTSCESDIRAMWTQNECQTSENTHTETLSLNHSWNERKNDRPKAKRRGWNKSAVSLSDMG